MNTIADRDDFAEDRGEPEIVAPPLAADDEADDTTDADVEPDDGTQNPHAIATVPTPRMPARLPVSLTLGGIAALVIAAAVGIALASVYRPRRHS